MPVRSLARALPAAVAVAALVAPAAAGARTSGHAVASAARAPKQCSYTHVVPNRHNLRKVRRAILCLHNQIRARHHLPLLRINRRLVRAAAGHSTSMVRKRYFDHTDPNGSTFVERIERARYVRRNQAWSLGENIAWGTGELSTPAGVMRAWMHSPGHRANILRGSYREVGIGIKLGVPTAGHTGATFTIDFGRRG